MNAPRRPRHALRDSGDPVEPGVPVPDAAPAAVDPVDPPTEVLRALPRQRRIPAQAPRPDFGLRGAGAGGPAQGWRQSPAVPVPSVYPAPQPAARTWSDTIGRLQRVRALPAVLAGATVLVLGLGIVAATTQPDEPPVQVPTTQR